MTTKNFYLVSKQQEGLGKYLPGLLAIFSLLLMALFSLAGNATVGQANGTSPLSWTIELVDNGPGRAVGLRCRWQPPH